MLRQRVGKLQERKTNLLNAFLDKDISKELYDEHIEKIVEELAIAEMNLNNLKPEESDMESLLDYSVFILQNASFLWLEADLTQRQRLQKVFYPEGVTFLDGKFGTTTTCLIFKQFEGSEDEDLSLASPAGFEPALPP